MFISLKVYNEAPKATSINSILLMITSVTMIGIITYAGYKENYVLGVITIIAYVVSRIFINKYTDKLAAEESAKRRLLEQERIKKVDPVTHQLANENIVNGRFLYPAQVTIVRKSNINGFFAKVKFTIISKETGEETSFLISNGKSHTISVNYADNIIYAKAKLGAESYPNNMVFLQGEKITLTYSGFKLIKVDRK